MSNRRFARFPPRRRYAPTAAHATSPPASRSSNTTRDCKRRPPDAITADRALAGTARDRAICVRARRGRRAAPNVVRSFNPRSRGLRRVMHRSVRHGARIRQRRCCLRRRDTLKEFSAAEDLGDWEQKALDTIPSVQRIVAESGSARLGEAIEITFDDICRGNLYAAVVGRSETTLAGAVRVAALVASDGIEVPDALPFRRFTFSEEHGWGHPFRPRAQRISADRRSGKGRRIFGDRWEHWSHGAIAPGTHGTSS